MTDALTPRYSIIFDGELIDGVTREVALDKLAHLTNLSEDELLDCLFSVKPVIAAQADNYQLADQFLDQFRQAGLVVSSRAYDQSHEDIVNADLSFGHYAPLETQYTKPNFVVDTPVLHSLHESDIHLPNGKFHVTFNGLLLEKFNRKQVMANLCSLTNSSEQDVLESIFSTVPVIFCQTNNPNLAKTYQQSFEQAGLEVHLSSNERSSIQEITARSYLQIRNDKPSLPPAKKMQSFTVVLYGLAVLACLCWVAIYMVIDSYLKKEATQSIQVQLVQYKAVEKIAPPPPVKLKKPKQVKKAQVVKKEPAKKKAAKPVKEQKKKAPTPAQPEKKAVALNEQKKVVEKEDKQQQKLKGEYNLQLLNWFAQFQQLNQLKSKYAEGEITLRLTISRKGEVKKIEVLKSTSEELQRAVVMNLRKAGTVPGVPIKITGSEYSFDLPLRYRFN